MQTNHSKDDLSPKILTKYCSSVSTLDAAVTRERPLGGRKEIREWMNSLKVWVTLWEDNHLQMRTLWVITLRVCVAIVVASVLMKRKPQVSEVNFNRLDTHNYHKKKHRCRLCKHGSYFIKSVYSIQKTPSLLPWAISSWRRCCGQSVHSSDQLPFHEKRPHGLRSRNNLKHGQRVTGRKEED